MVAATSAGDAGRDGRLVRDAERARPWSSWASPTCDTQKIDNPLTVPKMLSFLTYQRWNAEVKGMDAFPKEDCPTISRCSITRYHIMVGLGTMFIAVMVLSCVAAVAEASCSKRDGCCGS